MNIRRDSEVLLMFFTSESGGGFFLAVGFLVFFVVVVHTDRMPVSLSSLHSPLVLLWQFPIPSVSTFLFHLQSSADENAAPYITFLSKWDAHNDGTIIPLQLYSNTGRNRMGTLGSTSFYSDVFSVIFFPPFYYHAADSIKNSAGNERTHLV